MRSNMGRVLCYFVSLSAVTRALLQNRQGGGVGGAGVGGWWVIIYLR